MNEVRRRAYLEALGLDVWLLKAQTQAGVRLVVNPGRSGTLLICPSPEASVSRFAADIARALGDEPAWGWPDHDGRADALFPEEVVQQQLITRILVFGAGTAAQLFEGAAPDVLGSARILSLPDIDELAGSGAAKLALWEMLSTWAP